MISRILAFSIQRRWLVVLFSLAAMVLGAWSLTRLPIDAVPDITNKQVQVNTTAPALSPAEIEKQVTFRIETALAGIPGLENTRSLSRNGFSQVTAVFAEKTDIYFARQQVSERLIELRAELAARRRAEDGADLHRASAKSICGPSTMRRAHRLRQDSRGNRQMARISPPRPALATRNRAGGVSADSSGLDHPTAAQRRPGRRWVDSIGGYVKQYQVQPDPFKLIALGLSFGDIVQALEANNAQPGREHHRAQRRRHCGPDRRPARKYRRHRRRSWSRHAAPFRFASATSQPSRSAANCEPAAPAKTGMRSWSARRLMLIGGNSRTVATAVDAKLKEIRRTLPAGIEVKDRAQPDRAGRRHHRRPSPPTLAKARCW